MLIVRPPNSAERDTTDEELRAALSNLKNKLESSNECFHIVTTETDIPQLINPDFLHKELSALVEQHVTVKLIDNKRISLTSEMNGRKDFVTRHAIMFTTRIINEILFKKTSRNTPGVDENDVKVVLSQPSRI